MQTESLSVDVESYKVCNACQLYAKPSFSSRTHDGQSALGRQMPEDQFVAWLGEKTRAEWVDGEIIIMAPVSAEHDDFGWWLRTIFQMYVDPRGLGRVKGPEFMVRLLKPRRRRQPDLLFVSRSRESIIRKNHVEGAPDLIVELVSPDSVVRDWREKFLEYQAAGVREYWVIDRLSRRVEVYSLTRNGMYKPVLPKDGVIHSSVIKGFWLKVEWLVGDTWPGPVEVLRQLGVEF